MLIQLPFFLMLMIYQKKRKLSPGKGGSSRIDRGSLKLRFLNTIRLNIYLLFKANKNLLKGGIGEEGLDAHQHRRKILPSLLLAKLRKSAAPLFAKFSFSRQCLSFAGTRRVHTETRKRDIKHIF